MLYALDLYSYIYINYFSLKLEKNKNKKIKILEDEVEECLESNKTHKGNSRKKCKKELKQKKM